MFLAGVTKWVVVPAMRKGTWLEEQVWGQSGEFIHLFNMFSRVQTERSLAHSRCSADVCGG